MKIAVVADKKSGHLTQCLGLRDVIQDYDHEKDVLFLGKDFISLPGFLEKFFTFFKENFYLFILRLLNPSIGDKKYDLVICSGSRTVMPAYLVSIKTKAKIVYIGTPKFRVMKKFNGIISTKEDISSAFKVISTVIPPTKFKPYSKKIEPKKQSLVMLGGDGSGYDYGEKDWYRLSYEFKNINTTFLNSRRTPKFAWTNLKENAGKKHEFLDLKDTSFEILQNAIDSHSNIFVTADSTSMILEIISRGYFVNVIELRGPLKREHHHDIIEGFEKKGILKILRLNELHHSKDKYEGGVHNFVTEYRQKLREQLIKLV